MRVDIYKYFERVASWVNQSIIHQDEIGCFVRIDSKKGPQYFYYEFTWLKGKGSYGKVYSGVEYDPLAGQYNYNLEYLIAIKRLGTQYCPEFSVLDLHNKQSAAEAKEVALLSRFYKVLHKPRELVNDVPQDALIVMPYFISNDNLKGLFFHDYSTGIKLILDVTNDLALMHAQRVDPDVRAEQQALAESGAADDPETKANLRI